ncbi:hypothetical protein B7P43_G08769 [Cryptotermes secundus]|uniref:Mos1 transposase HTH domain-containing protein n=1 Tax=Cryptotermes secundus TaxID=105785 RepID=A0A2J7R2W6_9NEOP|nr:hypothetical protein B7P43_G08769 [Cryptotermes secundus]
MLKTAYKNDAMGKIQVFEWFSRFKNGEMSIDDKPLSGRPSTARTHENVEKIREIIKEDRRWTIEEILELPVCMTILDQKWYDPCSSPSILTRPCPMRLFFLFPQMKRDMKEKMTEALSSISKDEFRQCFEKWNKRLDRCISVSGEYFDGD